MWHGLFWYHFDWLPIKQRRIELKFEYKLVTLAFHYFDGTLPPYLSHCLSSLIHSPQIPSTDNLQSDKLLSVPHVNLWLDKRQSRSRLFNTDQAPGLWKCRVPIQTQFSPSLTSFKSSLKMHLFRTAFTWDSENWRKQQAPLLVPCFETLPSRPPFFQGQPKKDTLFRFLSHFSSFLTV